MKIPITLSVDRAYFIEMERIAEAEKRSLSSVAHDAFREYLLKREKDGAHG